MSEPKQDAAKSSAISGDRQPARNRRWWLYGAVGGVATLAGFGLALWRRQGSSAPASQASAFWQLSFDTPTRSTLRMQELAGKPLILNFWATWCPPCVEELPLLDRFFADHASNGWQVLGLAVDQPGAVVTFLQRAPVRFPVAMAGMAGIELSKSLGNLSGGLPFTVVLGKTGDVLHRKMGRLTEQDLRLWSQLR